jgi:hypothetical protein
MRSGHDAQVVTYPCGYERHPAGGEHIRHDRSVVAAGQDDGGRPATRNRKISKGEGCLSEAW